MTKQQLESVLMTVSGGKAAVSSLYFELSKALEEMSEDNRWRCHSALRRLNRVFEALDDLGIGLEKREDTTE